MSHSDISIVASNGDDRHGATGTTTGTGTAAVADAGEGARIGATVGGVGGLLAGLGLLVVPGLGPIVAAGWLGSTILGAIGGAAVGGATGGLVGSLTHAGVPEADAHVYAEGVRCGGSLVSARVSEDLVATAHDILNSDHRQVDLDTRRSAYRQEGWTSFNPDAPAYTRETELL